jgi:flagellar biosynthesis anti-sigma factor FlgM
VEIRNSLNSLNSIQELTKVAPTVTQAQSGAAAAKKESLSDRATLSSAANVIAQAAANGDVRTEKTAEIQAALAAGSYHVEPAFVAVKVVDSMLVKA